MPEASRPGAVREAAPVPPQPRSLRPVAVAVLAALIVLFALSIVMERRTPSSSQAVVQAYLVSMAAEVPGRVSEVAVVDNARIRAGEVLFRVDPQPYRIAVEEAEARLERIGQGLGASMSAVEAAQARVVDARANRENVRQQAGRAMQLVQRGVYPQARYDEAKAGLDRSDAAVAGAEAELERARLDLARATVVAPADGVVTNLQLAPGQYVGAGQAALTFVDAGTIWIAAAFKENSLEHVRAGNTAEVVFDTFPGRVFTARVESVGWGVSSGEPTQAGLPTVRNDSGWIREPQRFPVRLVFDGRPPIGVRYGSQANIVIYTGDNPATNVLGAFFIRLVALLTYVS